MTGLNTLEEYASLGEITPLGWVPKADMAYDEWEYAMTGFMLAKESLNWIVGDGLNFGEACYGETYAQAIEVTGWKYQRLADYKHVAAAVPHENRRDTLSWTHHRHVAKLPPEEQVEWLDKAEENMWSTSDLRKFLKPDGEGGEESRSSAELFIELARLVATGGDIETWGDGLSDEEKIHLIHGDYLAREMIVAIGSIVMTLGDED